MFQGLLIGLIIGFLEGLPVLFIPQEPHRYGVVGASTIKGGLIGLLLFATIRSGYAGWSLISFGAVYGCLLALVSTLPEGGLSSKEAKYIFPFGIAGGAIIGLLVKFFV